MWKPSRWAENYLQAFRLARDYIGAENKEPLLIEASEADDA